MENIKKICIIGGNVAGWWSAGYIEKYLPDVEITLYSTEEIPILGVGESTLPQLKWWFEELGIEESEWMDSCCAIKKYGNYKENWNSLDTKEEHPFITRFWHNENNIFDKLMSDNEYLSDKKINHQKFYDVFDLPENFNEYGYHISAEHAYEIVKKKCNKTKHVNENLSSLPKGYDLYLDCTGLNRFFIKDRKEMYIGRIPRVNSAWVCSMEKNKNDVSYTKSIARKYGWTFEISLTNRVGMGYVYNNKYVTDADALKEFTEIYKKENRIPIDTKPRLLKWNPLVLENPWCDNVVAIGAAAGFVDPLEATALFMTQSGITQLVKTIKKGYKKETYNKQMRMLWKDILDFQEIHYGLSKRKDTQFWIDNTKNKIKYEKMLWDYYEKKQNGWKKTSFFPSGVWAQIGIYFNELCYYRPKNTN